MNKEMERLHQQTIKMTNQIESDSIAEKEGKLLKCVSFSVFTRGGFIFSFTLSSFTQQHHSKLQPITIKIWTRVKTNGTNQIKI